MATAEVADVAVVHAEQPAAEVQAESKPAKEKKPRAPKAPKEKKPRAPKAPKEKKPKASKSSSAPSHPPYFRMIKDAILALNEKTGSSPYAIAKHMEEKHKGVLPANYKKVLAIQLRNFTAKGKLVKVKASFKLSETGKEEEKKKKKPTTKEKKQPAKETVSAPAKRKAPAAAAAPKKSPKPTKTKKPGVKKAKKASPAKRKQPKSIRSPAAKRAKKAVAA